MFLLVAVFLVAAEAASLGGEPCTRGPAFKCSSVQAASSCHAFSHCLNKVWKPQKGLHVHPTKECVYSQKAVKTVRHILAKDKGLGEAAHLMASMCSFIHEDDWRKECKDVVTGFWPQILHLMESTTEPATVAAVMGLCKPIESVNPLYNGLGAPLDLMMVGKTPGASEECQLCQFVVSTVDQLLTKNTTEAAFREALEVFCHKLPSGITDQCLSFVDEYIAMVVQLLVKTELDPLQVCQTLKLCNASSAVHLSAQLKKVSGAECPLCQLVLGAVTDMISSNKSEAEVRHALEKACSYFPSATSSECQMFVDTYTSVLVHLLVQEIKAIDICKKLGLCPDWKKTLVTSEHAGGLCTVCEVVMGMLEEMLARNTSEEDIEKALDKVCSLLPSILADMCKTIVNDYVPTIIDLLEHEHPPWEICTMIGLCNTTLTVPVVHPKADHISQGPAECELCKVIITELNTLIADNRSEQAIIKAVEKVCDILQGDLRLQCQSEVQNYGPAVLDLLQHMDDPTQVCTYLHLCSAASGPASVRNPSSARHFNGGVL